MGSLQQLEKLQDQRNSLPKHKTRRYANRSLKRVTKLAVHHSLTKSGSAKAFANYHINHHGWPGIGYHFVIEKDGDIIWCNDLEKKTYHVGNSNPIAIGVCLIGDFRYQEPTKEQLESLVKLANVLINDNTNSIEDSKDVWGHSEFPRYAWKACPVINMDDVRKDIGLNYVGPIVLHRPEEKEPQQYYVVKRGDTIWEIAHEHTKLRTKELLLLNPEVNPRRLKVGQKIRLF